jgi:syntaxin 1B/2/3
MQLLQSNRRGQAQSALRAVQGRHEAIQKIERQMIELAQLFQDVEAAVIQHEPAVVEIEQKAEATNENIGKANVEIDGAIAKARSRRRKQWWCLGILGTFSSPTVDFGVTYRDLALAVLLATFWLY